MIEAPNFDYKYDLALWKSFSARLSFAILVIAASIFMIAMLTYLYFSEESVKEETAVKARTQLHDAVMDMRMMATLGKARNDTLPVDSFIQVLKRVKPYPNSYTMMTDGKGRLVYVGDSSVLSHTRQEVNDLIATIHNGGNGMQEVFSGKNISLMIYEPVKEQGLSAAIVCSRTDILSSYRSLIFYGAVFFVLGLLILFSCCAVAIYRMVRPLHLFAESARSIADGNLNTPLPEIRSEDELLQLRNSFEYMQTSLKKYVEDLKATTAAKEHIQSELTIAHDIQMGMIPKSFPQRDDIDLYASMKPAREVGGDLYDFMMDGDELFMIIGDVAGKGVPASLYMAVTRTLFRNLAGNYQSASNIVREINRAIASDNDSCVFVTLFVGVLDLRNHILTYCNAAHNAPVLIPVSGSCRFLEVDSNVPVGVLERFSYEEQQIDFVPGMALLLYTDGLTEAVNPNRRFFGEEQLLKDLEISKTEEARNLVNFLSRRVEHFAEGAEQSDDQTMLFLRLNREPVQQVKPDGNEEADEDNSEVRHLCLKNEMAELERLRTFVFSVCHELGADDAFAISVNLAVEESVVNVINYAYPKGKNGHVDVYSWKEERQIVFRIKDSGIPFDPTKAKDADVDLPLEERSIGGLGIHLVRSIMDTIDYERTSEGFNLLTLRKLL